MYVFFQFWLLDDAEICFLYYKDLAVAKINRDNLIFKFLYMNECTLYYLEIFDLLDLPGKNMFVKDEKYQYKCIRGLKMRNR